MSFEKFLADIGDCIFLGNFKRNDVIRLPCLGDPFKYRWSARSTDSSWQPRSDSGKAHHCSLSSDRATYPSSPFSGVKTARPIAPSGFFPADIACIFFVFFFFFRIFHIKHTGAIFTDHTPDVCIVFLRRLRKTCTLLS